MSEPNELLYDSDARVEVPGRTPQKKKYSGQGPSDPFEAFDQILTAIARPSLVGSMLVKNPVCANSRRVNSRTPRVLIDPSSSPGRTRPPHSTLSVMKSPPGRRCTWARSIVSG